MELQKKQGKPSVLCFDAKTHLRVVQTGVQPSPGGDIPYRLVFGDWRAVNGIKTWYLEKMTAGPTTVEGRITSLVFDEKIPASRFKMPKPFSDGNPERVPMPFGPPPPHLPARFARPARWCAAGEAGGLPTRLGPQRPSTSSTRPNTAINPPAATSA